MRVMSAGDGYKYLLRTVAADGDRSLSTPLTRYYAEKGSSPCWWMGAGPAALIKTITRSFRPSRSTVSPARSASWRKP